MPIRSITGLYDFCEPMSDDNGEISLCIIPKGTAHTIVKKASDFDKSDVDMLKLISLEAWPMPNDFREDEEGTEPHKLDLRQLIFNCSCEIENYLRENISFVDERYYHICSIFIISTYFREDSTIFPRLIITGDTQSGKSRLQNAIRDLAYRCVKIGNGTFSSSFRTIDYYGTTTIFEEAQDYCRQDRASLMTIFKEGFEKGNVVARCDPVTFEPTQYRPESAMVISTRKTSILDDDVINRSFLIKMIRASDPKYARKRKDQKETDKIRTSLYHMKYVFTIQKSYYRERPNEHHFDLIKHIEESCDMLITDNIEVQEGPDSKKEIVGFSELTNREFDIACALYPFARITGHSLCLLQLLMVSKTNNVKKMVISDNGKIFRIWIELAREMCPHPKSRKMFRNVALRISTRDIRDRYVSSGRENGDIINDNDSIRTQDIRSPMMDMGFDLEYGKSTNGMTFVVPNGTFKDIFESNMKIYCDNEWNYDYLQLPEATGTPPVSELAISKGGRVMESYDPPRTDRYEHVWEIIDSHNGSENVLSQECIIMHANSTYRNTKKTTRDKYIGELLKFDRILKERGHDPLPWRVTEEVVNDLLGVVWKDREVSTKKWYTHILNRYLKFFGNRVVEDLHIRWPHDFRPNVKWLTDEEYAKLMKVEKTPLEDIVINLELGMGFRSVEVCRIRKCDVHFDSTGPYVNVRGKGQGEGKWRSIPFGNDTERAIKRWLEEREKIVKRMKAYDPFWKDPEELIIWNHYKSKPDAGPFSEGGNSLDRGPIKKLNNKVGFKFSQHTLRRSYGRRLHHAGVKIESISKLLGHEDIATTYKYLGMNMDDMRNAMEILKRYDERLI